MLVALDNESAIYAFPGLLLTGLPLIQIQAGGKVPHFPPIRLPGILVFSNELFRGYQKSYNIPPQFMCLSSGRVDFNYFGLDSSLKKVKRLFQGKGHKILTISRLIHKKIPSIINLFDQIQLVGDSEIIQLVIIGGGEAQRILEGKVAELRQYIHPDSTITFAGAFRVTPDMLKQADLVVGQGRTVIEAIASGIPAAVSGENGYYGLISQENFLDLWETNFTGRSLPTNSTLEVDLIGLQRLIQDNFNDLYIMAKDCFDVGNGVEAIISLQKKYYQYIQVLPLEDGHI